MSCGVGRKHGSDLVLLWLWCRLAAVAPIQPLAWELPEAMGVALKNKKIRNSWTRRTDIWLPMEREWDGLGIYS